MLIDFWQVKEDRYKVQVHTTIPEVPTNEWWKKPEIPTKLERNLEIEGLECKQS